MNLTLAATCRKRYKHVASQQNVLMTISWFGRNALYPNSIVAQDIAICIASSVKKWPRRNDCRNLAASKVKNCLRAVFEHVIIIQIIFKLITQFYNLISTATKIPAVCAHKNLSENTSDVFFPSPLFGARNNNYTARAKYLRGAARAEGNFLQ